MRAFNKYQAWSHIDCSRMNNQTRKLIKLNRNFSNCNYKYFGQPTNYLKCQQRQTAIKQQENFLRKLKFIFSIPINNIKGLFITNSVITTAIYITMIEGLGKGVKYSLFVANAIIFVSFLSLSLHFLINEYLLALIGKFSKLCD